MCFCDLKTEKKRKIEESDFRQSKTFSYFSMLDAKLRLQMKIYIKFNLKLIQNKLPTQCTILIVSTEYDKLYL